VKKKIALSLVVLLVLIVGVVWAFKVHANRQIEEVREMQKEMFAQGKPPKQEQFENFKEKMDSLSPSQREEVGKRAMEDGRRHMEKMLDDYYSLPKEKRNAFLDRQIKESEEMFKRGPGAGPPKGLPPPQGQPMKGDGPPRPGGPNLNAEQRNQFRNQMLDHSSPEMRAKFAGWIADMQARRKALGLPAFPSPPGPR
jgi:hypothetical protein